MGRRSRHAPDCWLVYLGVGPRRDDGGDLALAAITGSEAEAGALLAQAMRWRPEPPNNMIEDRPFIADRDDPGLGGGARRTVHVLAHGPDGHLERLEVFASHRAARSRQEEDLRAGIAQVRVLTVETNTWLIDTDEVRRHTDTGR